MTKKTAAEQQDTAYLLSNYALFHGFSVEHVKELLPKLEIRRAEYQEKSIVVWEDTPTTEIALVMRGEFIASRFGNEKSPQTMRIFFTGDILGLAEYLSSPKTWARTITCAKAGTLLWVNLAQVFEERGPAKELHLRMQLLDNMAQILANDAIKQLYRIEVISTNPLKDRIVLFLRIQQEKQGREWVQLRMNRGQFADYLCVDRATLSRELKKLETAGILQLRGDREYKIMDRPPER